MSDFKQIMAGVTTAAIIGFGGSYLTAAKLLATFEVEHRNLEERVETLEAGQRERGIILSETTTELRVLNERLKRFDTIEAAVERVEKKVDTIITGGQ